MNNPVKLVIGLTAITLLSACGGGSSGSSDDARDAYAGQGELTLSITDAPVDGAKEVWITIDGIHLKREGSSKEKDIILSGLDVDPVDGHLTVDLLSLSGGQLAQLFHSETVTSGKYEWVRFSLVDDSAYIVWEDDTQSELELPADKHELKTSGSFTVSTNQSVAYIIDWDLRKSIVARNKGYLLKPVLHIKRDDEYAYVKGLVSNALYVECDTESTEDDDNVPVVYFFQGTDIVPDDMDLVDGTVEPVGSVYVNELQEFYVGPVDAGDYTFAFTCEGQLDDPESDDALEFPEMGRVNVTLHTGDNGELTIH